MHLVRPRNAIGTLTMICTLLGGCAESLVPLQASGRLLAVGDSAVGTTDANGAARFRINAPVGQSVFIELASVDSAVQAIVGVLGALDSYRVLATVWADPAVDAAPVRSRSLRVDASGTLEVIVTAGGGDPSPRTPYRLSVHIDSAWDARFSSGPLVLGRDYAPSGRSCAGTVVGYVNVTMPDTLFVVHARKPDRTSVDVSFAPPVGVSGGGVGALAPWNAVPGRSFADLEQGATAPIGLPAPGRWGVISCDSTAPVRLRVRNISPAPERVSANVAVGDTVTGEAIDVVGDVDTFQLTGAPNDSIVILLTGGELPASRLRIERLDSFYGWITLFDARGSGAPLAGGRSPNVYLDAAGHYLFRVTSSQHTGLLNRGPYQFTTLHLPSTAPELTPVAVAIGDSVVTETLFTLVDRDDFRIDLGSDSVVMVEIQKLDDVGGSARLSIAVDGGGWRDNATISAFATGASNAARTGIAARGSVFVRVLSPDASFVGRYILRTMRGVVP